MTGQEYRVEVILSDPFGMLSGLTPEEAVRVALERGDKHADYSLTEIGDIAVTPLGPEE